MKNRISMPINFKMPTDFSKLEWPSGNLLPIVATALVATAGVLMFQTRLEANISEVKSVAWYTANQKETHAQNKLCFENPELKATENCVNSLHALEMLHLASNS